MSAALSHAAVPEAAICYVLPRGSSQYDVLDQLRALGLACVRCEPRGARSFLTYWFQSAESLSSSAEADGIQIAYQEDHKLGQRVLWLSAPDDALAARLSQQLGAQDLAQIVASAVDADTPARRIAALGPLAALLARHGELPVAARRLLSQWLADGHAAVRRATLFALSYVPFPEVVELLRAHASDPELSPEITRQLTLRGAAEVETSKTPAEEDRRHIEDTIAATPLDAEAYLHHAQTLQALKQPGFALAEAQIALALARRDGLPLLRHLALINALRPQVSALPAAWLPYIAQRLATLLRLDRPHVVIEVAEQLLPLLGSSLATAPLCVALARSHRQLGRPQLAHAALQPLCAALPAPAVSLSPSTQAAAAQHVDAELQFLLAQLTVEAHPSAIDAALVAVDRALSVLPSPTLVPTADAVQDLLIGALLIFFPADQRVTSRTLRFFRMQALASAERIDEALATSMDLLAEEPAAADVWLARAALLLHADQAEQALHACSQAEESMTPLDRAFESIDPLAILRLRQAIAHARMSHAAEAASCLRAALEIDPRTADLASSSPDLAQLLSDSPELMETLRATLTSLDEPDPYPRTYARQMTAACLRTLSRGSAPWALVLDFFAAGLLLLDRAGPVRRTAAGMTLLASLEAQLDLLASCGDTAAHSPAIHAAMAAMADALGL